MMDFPISSLDIKLFTILNGHHNAMLDLVFLAITQMGNGWVIIPAFAVLLALKYRRQWVRPVIVCACALTLSGLANTTVKRVVDRQRPSAFFASSSEYRVHCVGKPLHARSFPSGHTNTAFAVAALIVFLFGRRWWPVFIGAALAGYSRIYLGAHFPLDVAAGGVLGCAVASGVFMLMRSWLNSGLATPGTEKQ